MQWLRSCRSIHSRQCRNSLDWKNWTSLPNVTCQWNGNIVFDLQHVSDFEMMTYTAVTSFRCHKLHGKKQLFCRLSAPVEMCCYTASYCVHLVCLGWRGGSVGRASDSRTKGRGFESRQEHKKNVEFFRVKKVVMTCCQCAQPSCVYAHMQKTMYAR